MGPVLSAPVEVIHVQRNGSENFRVAVAEMQGWRNNHEDAHFVSLNGNSAFFGVLDGHGGSTSAEYCAQAIPAVLHEECQQNGSTVISDSAITDSFIRADTQLRESGQAGDSGSTAVCVAVWPTADGHYSTKLINCGDSRGLLVRRTWGNGPEIAKASSDHKPDKPIEKNRIEAAGGLVLSTRAGVARVDGNLAVSRAMGDFEYKNQTTRPAAAQKVTCVPDVYAQDLQAGDYVLLACDGIFDVLSNERLVQIVKETQLALADTDGDIGLVCAKVLTTCLSKESYDNMTMMMVELGVDGSAWGGHEDQLLDAERMDDVVDPQVRNAYQRFLSARSSAKSAECPRWKQLQRGARVTPASPTARRVRG